MFIDIPVSKDDPLYVQRVTLEGVDYLFRFDYNERENRWYLDIGDIDGNWLATGIKLVANVPLLNKRKERGLPPGELMVISLGGESPVFGDLGASATLLYATSDEIAGRSLSYSLESTDMIFPTTDPGDLPDTGGDLSGPITDARVIRIGGKAVAFESATSGHIAIKDGKLIAEPPPAPPEPSSDATKIRGTDVSEDPLLEGQTYVKSAGGALVPRFVSPSSDRLVEAPGTVFTSPGENVYVDVASGDVDIKLPASPVIGSTVRVKRLSANANIVVVDGNGATIDGDTAIAIKPGEAALFRCYAAGKWARMGKCEAVGGGVVAHLGLEYDPIALWRLDSAADYSGNGLNFTYTTPLFVATPTTGFSCHLSSNINALQGVGSQFSPILTADDITVQAIVLRSSTYSGSSGHRLIQLDNSSGGALRLNIAATSSSTTVAWLGASVTMPALPHGVWTHVAVTRRIIGSNAIVKLYIDGALSATSLPLELPPTFTGTPRVVVAGSIPNYNAYYGLIGSVKVNDFALDDAQVYAEAQRALRAP